LLADKYAQERIAIAYNQILKHRIKTALAYVPHVEEKQMFGGIAFMVNRKMCISVGWDRIMCRIDPALHRRNDKSRRQSLTNDSEGIVLQIKGEVVRFKELLRSVDYGIVIIDAYSHMLGVMAEHQWFHFRYPKSEFLSQELTTLDFITRKKKKKKSFVKKILNVFD